MATLLAACSGDGIPGAADGSTSGTANASDPATSTSTGDSTAPGAEAGQDSTGGQPPEPDIHGVANDCVAVVSDDLWLSSTDNGEGFAFVSNGAQGAARFFLKASDLATYLLYDAGGGYLVAEQSGQSLLRQTSLQSDVLLVDDTYVSGAEWELQVSSVDPSRYQLRHRQTQEWLGVGVLTGQEAEALPLHLEPVAGCTEHPELSLDAQGTVTPPVFADGSLFGIADTHSHLLSNFGFGGGGIFHGSTFHRLGVEHALPDCSLYHGEDGRQDFFGYAFDGGGAEGTDLVSLIPGLLAGELLEFNHTTAGYPEFTEWPNAHTRSTHQTQYYRWLERAWMGGLRLVVQHATTNSVICHMIAGQGIQPVRYSCEDMVGVDRIIDETYAMERYIDAQLGGPGQGWFRIVDSPAAAREVVAQGKMAVILGIETSDLFNCRLTPREGDEACTVGYLLDQLDYYQALGVRALFPVHKYDNAFSPGDGDRAFIELGNFLNTGHWSNFTADCPNDVPAVFDQGGYSFGALNSPREDYDSPAPLNFSSLPNQPLATIAPYVPLLAIPGPSGDHCQNAGLTPLGEVLLLEMMERGMIIEIDHLPQWSLQQTFAMLEANDYPAVGTHGGNYNGDLYQLGGVSKVNLGRCRQPGNPGATLESLQQRVALITASGGYPAEGFGFDLNGFAGAPGPRFGEGQCSDPQEDPVTYPFDSYAGDVSFSVPFVGDRAIDFNTEGFVHIGMLPELLEDARGDAQSDADLEPLFRSAEGYIRMWELAEQRAAALRGE
ncbi:MAG: dipeptidase [Deltaproteobacteria bacterium]|nr:dipeptidase [Deltaproteobacteria bacterium]